MNTNLLLLALITLIASSDAVSSSNRWGVSQVSPSTTASQTPLVEEPVTVETATGTLYVTLDLPRTASRVPVVLIIAGSGPTDRNGNSPLLKGANNSLKLLAEGLAARGIASLRYDKRGIGETGNAMRLAAEKAKIVIREEDLSFETLIADAVSWGKQLSADRRFSSLIVLGHSEGSLIGMIAAETIGAQAYVSIAGTGRPAPQILIEQLKSQLTPELVKASEEILQQLVAGKRVESVPSQLNLLFRPSVQPYLISWFHYDPVKEIARLKIPVLVVQGTTDIQVSLLEAKLLAGANPGATLVPIEGMNHVLKTVPSDRTQQVSSYSDPTLPIAPMLIAEISRFIGAKRP